MKKFDEIFAQRGEHVQPEKSGGIGYFLLVFKNIPSIAEVTFWKSADAADVKDQIFQDTGMYFIGGWSKAKKVFKATPDQVELLNSYRV